LRQRIANCKRYKCQDRVTLKIKPTGGGGVFVHPDGQQKNFPKTGERGGDETGSRGGKKEEEGGSDLGMSPLKLANPCSGRPGKRIPAGGTGRKILRIGKEGLMVGQNAKGS